MGTTTNRELGDQIRKRIATLPTITVKEACSPALEDVLDAGFTIYSPVLLRDERTLVYIVAISGAVKANWASLRQPKKSRYFYGGQLEVTKEDKPTKTKS